MPRAIRLFRPYRTQVSTVGVLILLTAGLGVVNPVLIKFVFDNVQPATASLVGPPRQQ